MYFDSIADIFYMNGHGVFVWSAYLLSFLCVLLLIFSNLKMHKSLLKRLRDNYLMQKNNKRNE